MKSDPADHFADIFQRLKQILIPYAPELTAQSDTPTNYQLVGPSGGNPAKRFGGVAIRQSQVTFYSCPTLLQEGSPALRARMKGTSSVSFTEVDEPVIRELDALTAKRFQAYQAHGVF